MEFVICIFEPTNAWELHSTHFVINIAIKEISEVIRLM